MDWTADVSLNVRVDCLDADWCRFEGYARLRARRRQAVDEQPQARCRLSRRCGTGRLSHLAVKHALLFVMTGSGFTCPQPVTQATLCRFFVTHTLLILSGGAVLREQR